MGQNAAEDAAEDAAIDVDGPVVRGTSTRSRLQHVTTTVSKAPTRAGNLCLDTFCRHKRWQLIATVLLGVFAVYIHASSWMSAVLFGSNWERSWLWWMIAVPMDVYLIVYFTRFLGAFLVRTWLLEISESKFTRQAIITVAQGLVQDARVAELTAVLLAEDAVVDGVQRLTAAVLRSPEVRQAAAGTTAHVLQSPETQASVVEASGALLQSPVLAKDMEVLLGRRELGQPLAAQAARLLEDQEVRQAVSGLIHDVLEDRGTREVVHLRAVSLAEDRRLYEAGRRGVTQAIFRGCTAQDPSTSHQSSESG